MQRISTFALENVISCTSWLLLPSLLLFIALLLKHVLGIDMLLDGIDALLRTAPLRDFSLVAAPTLVFGGSFVAFALNLAEIFSLKIGVSPQDLSVRMNVRFAWPHFFLTCVSGVILCTFLTFAFLKNITVSF